MTSFRSDILEDSSFLRDHQDPLVEDSLLFSDNYGGYSVGKELRKTEAELFSSSNNLEFEIFESNPLRTDGIERKGSIQAFNPSIKPILSPNRNLNPHLREKRESGSGRARRIHFSSDFRDSSARDDSFSDLRLDNKSNQEAYLEYQNDILKQNHNTMSKHVFQSSNDRFILNRRLNEMQAHLVHSVRNWEKESQRAYVFSKKLEDDRAKVKDLCYMLQDTTRQASSQIITLQSKEKQLSEIYKVLDLRMKEVKELEDQIVHSRRREDEMRKQLEEANALIGTVQKHMKDQQDRQDASNAISLKRSQELESRNSEQQAQISGLVDSISRLKTEFEMERKQLSSQLELSKLNIDDLKQREDTLHDEIRSLQKQMEKERHDFSKILEQEQEEKKSSMERERICLEKERQNLELERTRYEAALADTKSQHKNEIEMHKKHSEQQLSDQRARYEAILNEKNAECMQSKALIISLENMIEEMRKSLVKEAENRSSKMEESLKQHSTEKESILYAHFEEVKSLHEKLIEQNRVHSQRLEEEQSRYMQLQRDFTEKQAQILRDQECTRCESLSKSLSELKSKYKSTQKESSNIKENYSLLQLDLDDHISKLKEKEQIIEDLRHSLNILGDQNKSLLEGAEQKTVTQKLESEIHHLKEENNVMKSKYQTIETEKCSLEKALEELQGNADTLKGDLKQCEEMNDSLNEAIQKLSREKENAEAEHEEFTKSLEIRNQELESKLDGLDKEKRSLEERIDELNGILLNQKDALEKSLSNQGEANEHDRIIKELQIQNVKLREDYEQLSSQMTKEWNERNQKPITFDVSNCKNQTDTSIINEDNEIHNSSLELKLLNDSLPMDRKVSILHSEKLRALMRKKRSRELLRYFFKQWRSFSKETKLQQALETVQNEFKSYSEEFSKIQAVFQHKQLSQTQTELASTKKVQFSDEVGSKDHNHNHDRNDLGIESNETVNDVDNDTEDEMLKLNDIFRQIIIQGERVQKAISQFHNLQRSESRLSSISIKTST